MAGSNLSQTRGVTSSSQGAVGSAPAAVSGVLSESLIASYRLPRSAQPQARAADHITSCVPLLVKQTLSPKKAGPTSRRSTAWLLSVEMLPFAACTVLCTLRCAPLLLRRPMQVRFRPCALVDTGSSLTADALQRCNKDGHRGPSGGYAAVRSTFLIHSKSVKGGVSWTRVMLPDLAGPTDFVFLVDS